MGGGGEIVPQRAREGALVKIHQAAVDSPGGMSVQFFGQFLVSSGEISEAALLEALDLQSERNRKQPGEGARLRTETLWHRWADDLSV